MGKVNNVLYGIYIDNDTDLIDVLSEISNKKCEIVNYDSDEFLILSIKDMLLSGLKKDITLKKIKQALMMLGLTDKDINTDPMKLTNSERYKLLIARALMNKPDTLILCFPNIYLDDANMKQVLQLVRKMAKELGKKIYIISNDIDYIYKECDNIIIYKSKKIIFNDSRKKLYDNRQILLDNNIDLPLILNFISMVDKKNNIKLMPTYDIKELMKDIYRNV